MSSAAPEERGHAPPGDVSASGPPAPVPPSTTSRRTLADGESIVLREVTPADEQLLLSLLEHVTGESRWLRFFTGGADIRRAAAEEARCDDVRLGVLALSADGTRILGHGMCFPAGGETAEIAFEVADGQHRRGIGGTLLAYLTERARSVGYRELVAEVLPSNRDMIDLLIASGLPLRSRTSDGVRHVSIPLDAPDAGPPAV